MENYICFNGTKIPLTNEQVKEMQKSLKGTTLKDIPVGKTFKLGKYEFIVLEHSKDTTAVIMKNLLENSVKFGDNCDFKTSNVKNILGDFADKISGIIGADNLIEHTVDLTSNDGLKDYGKTKEKMSLLTADLYRRYVEILDKHKIDKWWWLATPYSTPKHGYSEYVLCVAPSGIISDRNFYGGDCGVRPFCILNSNIFVSCN